MAIKLTYTDGQESQYGDDTKWEVDDGVLKLGKEEGKWSVLLSPSHWAVIEVGGSKAPDDKSDSDDDDSDDDDSDDDDSDDDDDASDDEGESKKSDDKDDEDKSKKSDDKDE